MKWALRHAAIPTLLAIFSICPAIAYGQGTAFTYQGRLNDGSSPATGEYDLRFTLYSLSGGSAGPMASPIEFPGVPVTNGLFAVTLDFGDQFPGADRWLEIAVRTNGGGDFAVLSPRQALAASPYSITASKVTGSVNAGQLSGTLPISQITGTLPLAQLPAGVVTNGAGAVNLAGTFSGNGASLTNVSAPTLWQKPAGTSLSLTGGTAYLLTNDLLVTLSLPVAPGVGDVFRVSGGGSGGWRITQNASQIILADMANKVQISDAPLLSWRCLAASANGAKVVAGPMIGKIYFSQASGLTWSQSGSSNMYWKAVASSTNGSRLAAARSVGGIYTNLGTSGSEWAATPAPITNWTALVSSADGVKLAAAVGGYSGASSGPIYVSSNSGATWTATAAPLTNWLALASSGDGTKLVAAVYVGGIYVSANPDNS